MKTPKEIAQYLRFVDSSKVSIDYDGTASTEKGTELAKRLIKEGKTLYIITRRQHTDSKPVYAKADELNIPHSRVHFTDGKLKDDTIKRLNIGKHIDNNSKQIDSINKNTEARGILFKN